MSAGGSSAELGMAEAEVEKGLLDDEAEEILLDDDEDEDDEDELFWSSDEEEDQEATSKKKQPLGAWKANLKNLSQNGEQTLPEEHLHIVRWGVLAKHFVRNLVVFGLFIAFVFVSQCAAVVALPLFLLTFFELIVVIECLVQLRVQVQVATALFCAAAIGGGVIAMGPFEFFQLLSVSLFAPLLLVILVLMCSARRHDSAGVLQNSLCWQALTGRRYIFLTEDVNLAALCKAIVYRAPRRSSWVADKFFKVAERLGYDYSPITVEMVRVDEQNPDCPDLPLVLSGAEVDPGEYVLTQFVRKGPEGDTSQLDILNLQRVLARCKQLSDKKVDAWLNLANTSSAQAEGEAIAQEKTGPEDMVRQWMRAGSLPPTGQCSMRGRLRRAQYWDGLFEHWAACAAWCVVFCSVLSLPTIHIFMGIDASRRELCDVGGPHHLAPVGPQSLEGVLVCGGQDAGDATSCVHVCKTFLSFVAAVHDKFQTSYVELLIVLVLLPVSVFTFSVRASRHEHNTEERRYLRCLQMPKKGVNEVTKLKRALEDVFKLSSLADRLVDACRAWLGADSALRACGRITDAEFDLTATRGFNDCFRQVLEPVTAMKSAISCEKSEQLPYGIGYDDDEDLDEEYKLEGQNVITNAWDMLKFRNGLGDTDRNYKILFDLQIFTEDSWKLFKSWCKDNYKEQMDFIADLANAEAQDSGKSCHLKENTRIYDILLPRGFSLTHVYVQSMPEDGMPHQIELTSNKNGATGFLSKCDDLLRCIKCAKVDEEEEEDEDVSVLDQRLANSPLVARFALSEQYFNSMSSAEMHSLCPDLANRSGVTFTDFVDSLLKPAPIKVPEDEPEGKSYLFYTGISVFMGDESPLGAMLVAMKAYMGAVSVYLQCAVVAGLIPGLRVVSGGSLFPQPFAVWMLLNTLSIWLQLANFFADFNVARTRLSMIGQCLHLLENKTLASGAASGAAIVGSPGGDPAAAPEEAAAEPGDETGDATTPAGQSSGEGADKEEDKDEQKRKAREKKKSEEDTRPFDLVVCEQSRQYNPSDEFWVNEWRKKCDNVQLWHTTVANLRVFVSTSRLTAQTMLVAAAVVVGALLLISIMQSLSGQGPLAEAAQARVEGQLGGAVELGSHSARRLHEQIGEALTTLGEEHLLARLGSAATAAAAVAGAAGADIGSAAASGSHQGSVQEATHDLEEDLEPARASLYEALLRQQDALAEGHRELREAQLEQEWGGAKVASMRSARRLGAAMTVEQVVGGVSKATKTQIFTIAMVLLVMWYSIPLMWNIVLVNGYFDRHDDLLLKQREQHSLQHTRRERKRQAGAAGGSPEQGDNASPVGLEIMASSDPERQLYETMLGTAAKSAKKTRERFPLKLFGFVISTNLLATWVGLAAAPLLSQAKQMAPSVAVAGCSWLEHSRWVSSLQHQVDVSNPEMHVKVRALIHDNVCAPLKDIVTNKLNQVNHTALGAKVGQKLATRTAGAAQAKKRRRRLGTDPDLLLQQEGDQGGSSESQRLRAIVRSWWRAHPDVQPDAKLTAAQLLLLQLRQDGDRLLALAPEAVLRAFGSARGGGPEAPFWSASGAARPHLELALLQSSSVGSASSFGVFPSAGAAIRAEEL